MAKVPDDVDELESMPHHKQPDREVETPNSGLRGPLRSDACSLSRVMQGC